MTNEKKARDLGVSFSEYICYKTNEHEEESMFYEATKDNRMQRFADVVRRGGDRVPGSVLGSVLVEK